MVLRCWRLIEDRWSMVLPLSRSWGRATQFIYSNYPAWTSKAGDGGGSSLDLNTCTKALSDLQCDSLCATFSILLYALIQKFGLQVTLEVKASMVNRRYDALYALQYESSTRLETRECMFEPDSNLQSSINLQTIKLKPSYGPSSAWLRVRSFPIIFWTAGGFILDWLVGEIFIS